MGPHTLKTRGCLSQILYYLTWERSLRQHANGGAVIAWRALATSVPIFAATLLVKNVIDPKDLAGPAFTAIRTDVTEHLHWWGVILAGVYAALYSRFAAQWEYVAELYNQIKTAECQGASSSTKLAEWKAAFIEDCEDLHLLRKPSFASTIRSWADEQEVRRTYENDVVGGRVRLNKVLAIVDEALEKKGGLKRLQSTVEAARTE